MTDLDEVRQLLAAALEDNRDLAAARRRLLEEVAELKSKLSHAVGWMLIQSDIRPATAMRFSAWLEKEGGDLVHLDREHLEELTRERDRALEAVSRYGKHWPRCGYPCSCGLEAFLDAFVDSKESPPDPAQAG